MTSPVPEDKYSVPLRVAEAVRDELLELAKKPIIVSVRDDFATMWYPAMKAAVEAGYDLKTICDKMRAKAKVAFPLRALEEMYATAKADEEKKKSPADGAPGSSELGATVTPITRRRGRAGAADDAAAGSADGAVVPKTASAAAASDAFDAEDNPNNPEALKSV